MASLIMVDLWAYQCLAMPYRKHWHVMCTILDCIKVGDTLFLIKKRFVMVDKRALLYVCAKKVKDHTWLDLSPSLFVSLTEVRLGGSLQNIIFERARTTTPRRYVCCDILSSCAITKTVFSIPRPGLSHSGWQRLFKLTMDFFLRHSLLENNVVDSRSFS